MTAAVDMGAYEFLDAVFVADRMESVQRLRHESYSSSLMEFYLNTSHKLEDFIERWTTQPFTFCFLSAHSTTSHIL